MKADIKQQLCVFLDYGDGKPESFFVLVQSNECHTMCEYFANGESKPRYWLASEDGGWWPYTEASRSYGRKLNRELGMDHKLIQGIYDQLFDLYAESEIL